ALLQEISALAPEALLTDTASLKTPLLAAAQALRPGSRFVGGHPMAGSRSEGVAAARADLFRDRPWAFVPTDRSDPDAIATLSDLVRGIGARPVVLEAERHDLLMTWISHLPHAVAVGLTRAAAAETGSDLAALAGPGFLDTTRIAGRRLELALELALADPEALARAVDAVVGELSSLSARLRQGDADAVACFFQEAAAIRRAVEPQTPSDSRG
ncbi:MAG: prephenate dehydrogenase/arogenate dehydrogenase family protein, partial [Acidobacteriota bacterium]